MIYQIEYDYELLFEEPIRLPTTNEEVSMLSFYVRFGTLFPSKEDTTKKIIISDKYFSLSDLLSVSYSNETKQLTYQLNDKYTEGYDIVSYYVGVGRNSVSPRKSNKDEFFWIIENFGEKIISDSKLQTNLFKIFKNDKNLNIVKEDKFMNDEYKGEQPTIEDIFIFSDHEFFDRNRNLLRYKKKQMDILCLEELGEVYVTPFQKLNRDPFDFEYVYTTYSLDFKPIQTCGVLLDRNQREKLIAISGY